MAGVRLVGEVEAWLAAQAPSGRAVELSPVARRQVTQRAEQIAVVATDDVLRVLADATSALLERGWIRGASSRPEGLCLSGALEHVSRAMESTWGYQRSYDAGKAAQLAVEVVLLLQGVIPVISAWNDKLQRTRREVLAVLAGAQQVAVRIGASR
ncbi:DUF6197 family protein [Streptomyces xiamenensis]|uniref:DUF6197 family protein n=1 Tax=Streptomyces xiamenensis TaxID=408015 RepID=UPI0037D07286